jgi:hypothetical protein
MRPHRRMDDDLHRLEAKGLARAKIRSQRLRVSRIRRHTVRGSVALFVVLWGVIFGQLVTGNDPALSAKWGRKHALAKHSAHRNPEPIVQAHAPLPTEVEPEPGFEVEQEFEEEPAEVEFETEPVEETAPVEVAPEPVEPIVTSSS